MNSWSKWGSLIKSAGSAPGYGGVLRRIFAAYAGISLLLFALATAAALWQTQAAVSPKAAMKRMAASVSPQFFIDMIGLEAASLKRSGETTFSGGSVGRYLAEKLLHVNPVEPKSLLASELPGMRGTKRSPDDPKRTDSLVVNGNGNAGQGQSDGNAAGKPADGVQTQGEAVAAPGSDAGKEPPLQPTGGQGANGVQPDPIPVKPTTAGRKVVFVYHSHPRESWVPELKVSSANEAEDSQKNVTLVGKRLTDKLEEQGIGSVHSGVDYPTNVPGYNWNYSYKYSLQTVKEAFTQNKDIAFLFDIHRDSAARDITTASIGGTDYARVYFIVGKKNERWEQNEAFARKIHNKLEAEYPGLSRGIWDKGSGGHAEYNQSVSPNSILIEVGGPFNSLEESYRTADILAKTISGLYWEAEKVNATAGAAVAVNK
ncbi:stage II sporulation protein P [Paenibacillus mesophilus]|uniref:stage II sporulation protein P n=1 Tax=Paenibacillus mesophilus TaxID=2582849 RepID=UPI00110E650A|nr:stage II sporulation protein P [Paenibacillus mesophilus]TMV45674.1 stage II sporulation protein P [Paenibacillus mesophilus]